MMFSVVTTAVPTILDLFRHYYTNEADGRSLLNLLSTQTNPQLTFSASNGLVMFKDIIYIPDFDGLRRSLLTEFHDSTIGGHLGVRATLARLAASFFWPGLPSDVKEFVWRCVICQTNKYNTQKALRTLQPLPIPRRVWEDLSMDFITHLPISAGKTVIWVVVDRLSKYAHFIGLPPSSQRHLSRRSFLELFVAYMVYLK
ncbi:UNVERIFIED_CONTAM: hypothetical protein Sradi_0707900 [Sesamum radiatum]|uniref:Integrase zinc-binding domain-containing protein n=1 Tax=Sesamum radiatum TaxID=300843 RepID=A0AAW2VML5_SESRA